MSDMTRERRALASPRRSIVLAVLGVIGLTGACTGGGASGGSATPTTIGSGGASSPSAGITPKPGEYTYENAGITAGFKYEPGGGSLSVKNGSGSDVGRPGLYVLDARDGTRINGSVQNAADLGPGDSGTFQVKFPDRLESGNVGFVVLILGNANYGGFVPPA
jgi:hypothetical protein